MKAELPDLFPGFDCLTVEAAGERVFCRVGGSGEPLLLLHGYPQSHICWHKVAPKLAEHFKLVIPDLPGYGRSSIPALSERHVPYSKRSFAKVFAELMRVLGHERFFVAGHDRGGRVCYRLALDHPEKIAKIALLDILPTSNYWDMIDRRFGLKIYHWMFLAQPAPFPEKLIMAQPAPFLEQTLKSWTASKSLDCFTQEAMAHNRAWFCEPDRIAATCEDYRAGATVDYDHDKLSQEMNEKISAPMLILWGAQGIANSVDDPLAVWRDWGKNVSGSSLASGHFLPEEAPEDTAKELFNFFAA